MGKPELGAKCTCVGCGLRFYDLSRSPAMCPKCGAQQPPEKPRMLRSSRGPVENTPLLQQPDPVAANDDAAQTSTAETEDEEDTADPEDEISDDIELDPDHDKAPD